MKLKSLLAFIIILFILAGTAAPSRARPLVGATILVTTQQDELKTDGNCSLREAIQAANQDSPVDACPGGSGKDLISLPPGLYTLTLSGANEDGGLTGDLDLLDDLVIQGGSAEQTIIDGNGADRVFHVAAPVSVEIINLTIQNGTVSGTGLYGGAGILNEKGSLTIRKSIIQENHTAKVGGGMDNASTANLVETIFRGNQSISGGGIFNTGMISIESSSLVGNSAEINGGGLDNRDTGSVINSTFSGNSAVDGGGIINDGELTLHNVTISENSSGVANAYEVRFKNTIVANSTGGENCTGRGTFTTEGHNLDSGNTCNFTGLADLASTNPGLGPLDTNQGFTLSYSLLANSPAIDQGDDADCPRADQRGASRPADGDGDGHSTCDIGSFELGGTLPSLVFIPIILR